MEDVVRGAELETLSRRTIAAITRGDIRELGQVVSKDFTFIDDRGMLMRAGACFVSLSEMISNPPPDRDTLHVNFFRTDDIERRFYGDTVVETMIYTDDVVVRHSGIKDRSFARSFRVTNIWVQQDDRLQLASTQLTPIQWA